jgi:site-specific DNA-methyltransferase (adenine-specific)
VSAVKLLRGDCIDLMARMPADSVDAVVTDPPYGLHFMGAAWDTFGTGGDGHGLYEFSRSWAKEALRVLRPGGHLLAFGGTRTYHRMVSGIEDAGFEVRDCISWIYGTGFPKSLDVAKAIDRQLGAARPVVGTRTLANDIRGAAYGRTERNERLEADVTLPGSPAAARWAGWGTALKPAHEPIVMARRPLAQRTVAQNLLRHGTGAVNVDGCRLPSGSDHAAKCASVAGLERTADGACYGSLAGVRPDSHHPAGRWPANLVLGHAPRCRPAPDGAWRCSRGCPVAELDRQSGHGQSRRGKPRAGPSGIAFNTTHTGAEYDDAGGASRFFYVAKASSWERNFGMGGQPGNPRPDAMSNEHPTVKPVELMRYLCRLVTPPGGVVLDPFMGSGSTGIAAVLESARFVGIERERRYFAIAKARILHVARHHRTDEATPLDRPASPATPEQNAA